MRDVEALKAQLLLKGNASSAAWPEKKEEMKWERKKGKKKTESSEGQKKKEIAALRNGPDGTEAE